MRSAHSGRGRTTRTALATAGAIALGLVLLPTDGEALPAFGRQFNVKCSTCHTPIPRRLNNIGIAFKRMGYRMPDADDQGKLILKDKPSRGSFDDFSLIADVRGLSKKGTPAAFEMHEVEVMGAGALGSHLSYAAEVGWEAGEFDLSFAEGQLLLGRPETNFTARFGLLPTLLWDKYNGQRSTIARPLLVNNRVPAGAFKGLRLRDVQPGVELGLNFNKLGAEGGNLRSTYLALGILNGLAQQGATLGENNDFKDLMFQAMQLWGENNTVGVLWYRGKVTGIGTDATENTIDRLAVTGNYRLKSGTDLVAGFGVGGDDATARGVGKVKSRGWFAELDQAIGKKTVAVVRWDRFEPNQSVSSKDVSGPTVSATHHVFDNLLLTAEYQGLKTGSGERTRDITLRAVVIY